MTLHLVGRPIYFSRSYLIIRGFYFLAMSAKELKEFIAVGQALGYAGEELRQFIHDERMRLEKQKEEEQKQKQKDEEMKLLQKQREEELKQRQIEEDR